MQNMDLYLLICLYFTENQHDMETGLEHPERDNRMFDFWLISIGVGILGLVVILFASIVVWLFWKRMYSVPKEDENILIIK